MINIYNWSYEIDKTLVRIQFLSPIKTKLLSVISKFNGQILPVAPQQNVFIVKFKSEKNVNDFISYTTNLLPNSFHLINDWELTNYSEKILSFTVMKETPSPISSFSEVLSSFITDYTTISGLTKNKIVDIHVNIDSSICYMTFNIKFSDSNDAIEFTKDFLNFKA